ncbi:MAG: LysM peptidoglycan-binding domain-containing protein [candidate division Zixibacteria bacterium]|nr:LysM peptidoglycan-binding domain-containing protein [candidate division Zixibacteria bacterium]NIW40988.1 LysM peptidoglycan-binding domain-containing protein [candidate division Zixibacteria bacterium]
MMRELFRIALLLGLTAMLSCSSHLRDNGTAEADLPPVEETYVEQDEYYIASDEFEDSTDILEFEDPEAPESQITDEDIRYKFSLAEEYYAFGVAANLKKNWDEAQYNFEKAIEILTSMDLTFDTTDAEMIILEHSYRRLMNEIASDYKLTLFNLNILSEEASPFAIDEKFELLDSLTGFARDTIVTTDTGIKEVTYDMPIVLNDRVKKWIIYFQTSARKNMEIWLARSGMYIPLMEKILEEEGVPHDLVYLPIIESGFSSRAYSSVAAIGFWQFMSYTAKDWGLKMNWWYDERRDFERATRAAAKLLKYLYGATGDWRLALTAYNGGLRNVNLMKNNSRNRGKDYWDWRIRNSQMRNFVPKYMAATIIAKQPERYGFDIQYAEPLKWDVVTIDRAIYLKDIAEATGVSVQKIKELNPAILRDYTPPKIKQFKLRIPVGRSSQFYADYGDMKSPKETSWVRHRIRRGETVSSIARKYGVSQAAIIQTNDLRWPYRIYVGNSLMVPVPLDRGTSYASRNYELTGDVYIVRPGDNLNSIASGFGTSVNSIVKANNLRNRNVISVGQRLTIPGYSGKAYAEGEYFYHTIRRGDALYKLASRYGTTINDICNMNGISRRTTLVIGRRLKIPGSPPGESYASSSKPYTGEYFTHTIRRGQNLSYLADKYGTSVSEICRANGMSSRTTLYPGQKLKIPGKEPSSAFKAHAVNTDSGEGYFVHTIRRGENLTNLARKYGTTVNSICGLNGISSRRPIYPGQKLKIPGNNSSGRGTASSGSGNQIAVHTVARGENLTTIANSYGTTVDEICALNGISKYKTLYTGEKLNVPFGMGSGEIVVYVVRRGDTLWDIARTFGTSTHEIINLNNHINPRNLRVGEKLKIKAK